MFRRIQNLWRLSEFRPEASDSEITRETLRRDIERKPKGKATVVEDDPLSVFPEEDPENI